MMKVDKLMVDFFFVFFNSPEVHCEKATSPVMLQMMVV